MTVFRHQPQVPSVNKWTKLGPCCDAIAIGILTHRVFPLCPASLRIAHAAPRGEDADADFLTDADFSSVQGRRFRLACGMLQDPLSQVALVMLCLVLEPIRHITAWLMRRACESEAPCGRPPVVDVFSAAMSPVVHARQYIATLLAERSSRMLLLWRLRGCEFLDDWHRDFPNDLRLLRRLILVADAAIYRRMTCRLRRYPWCLLSLIDERNSRLERLRLAEKFFRTPECCLPVGFAKKVLPQSQAGADLLEAEWTRRLQLFARLLTLQCADVEWRHGRNRARAKNHGHNSIPQTIARSVCAEALVIQQARCERQSVLHRRQQPARNGNALVDGGIDVSDGDRRLHACLRKPSPLDLYSQDFFARCKARDVKMNPVLGATKKKINDEFEALEPVGRQAYVRPSLGRSLAW